jgi:hypothetical protein
MRSYPRSGRRSRLGSAMLACAIASCAWPAYADQCVVVDEVAAARAVDALRSHPDVVMFCEPCGDAAPGMPGRITHAAARRNATGYEVAVDGRPIDLAYTYVQTSSHRYDNLAALAACPTQGVSASLAIDYASRTGVLIHADPAPRARAPERAAPPATAHVPTATPALVAPPAAAPSIYIVTPSSALVGWDVVMLAFCMTLAVWWLGAGWRRRRAMRPRATDL